MGIHEFEHEQQIASDIAGGAADSPEKAEADVGAAHTVSTEFPPYTSNRHGHRIRHAMTGSRYSGLVGSRDEYRYFKVHDATTSNREGCGDVFFFDSPADYEHYDGIVAEQVARDWLSRRRAMFGY